MVLKMVLRGLMLAVGVTVAAFSGQHADAAVVNLTVSPSSIAFDPSGTTLNSVSLSAGVLSLNFAQVNDPIGKDLSPGPGGLSFVEVADGTPITAALSFNSNFAISASESGDKFYAFKFSDGGLDYFGWIKENLGGSGGTINILAAAYQSVSGDPILAGQTAGGGGAVPEPATAAIFGLATLVAGARGFKARRKAQAAS